MINSKCNSLDNFDSDLMPDIHSSSDEYAKRFSGEFGEFALGVQGKLTLTILQNHDDIKTILDVGGGHGQLMPFIKDKGYDILYLTEYVDEFAIKTLMEYEGKKFINVCSKDLNLNSEEENKKLEKLNKDNEDLFKKFYADKNAIKCCNFNSLTYNQAWQCVKEYAVDGYSSSMQEYIEQGIVK